MKLGCRPRSETEIGLECLARRWRSDDSGLFSFFRPTVLSLKCFTGHLRPNLVSGTKQNWLEKSSFKLHFNVYSETKIKTFTVCSAGENAKYNFSLSFCLRIQRCTGRTSRTLQDWDSNLGPSDYVTNSSARQPFLKYNYLDIMIRILACLNAPLKVRHSKFAPFLSTDSGCF